MIAAVRIMTFGALSLRRRLMNEFSLHLFLVAAATEFRFCAKEFKGVFLRIYQFVTIFADTLRYGLMNELLLPVGLMALLRDAGFRGFCRLLPRPEARKQR